MSDQRRLHPLALLIFFLKKLRDWFFVLLIIFIPNDRVPYKFALPAGLVLLFVLIFSCLAKYFFIKYQLTDDSLIIRTGLINKNQAIIPYTRMQNIKNSQNILLRPFDLTKLEIETAAGGSDKAEASLEVVPLNLQDELLLKMNHGQIVAEKEKRGQASYSMSLSQNIARVLSTPGREIGYLLIALVLDNVVDIIKTIVQNRSNLLEGIFKFNRVEMAIIVGIALIIYLLNFVYQIVSFYNFTVTRTKNSLEFSRGLIKRVNKQIPLNKIQTIIIEQSLLQQILQIASVRLQLAGGQEDDEGLYDAIYFLPLIRLDSCFELMAEFLPEWELEKPNYQLTGRGIWYFTRWIYLWALVSCLMLRFSLIIGLVLLFAVLIYGMQRIFQKQSQGYAINPDSIWIRYYSYLNRRQVLMIKDKIQAVKYMTTPFLLKKNLGHVIVVAKSGNGEISARQKFVDKADFKQIQDFYLD